METGDLCPFCMRSDCASAGTACPTVTAHMAAQTSAEARAADAVAICGFCFGAGGYRVPCHGCGKVGS